MSTKAFTVSSPAPRFDSLAALEAEHSRLVQDLKTLLATPAGTERVLHFVRRAAATGSILDAREDRTTAQGLINFWTAKLASTTNAADFEETRPPRPRFEDSLLAEYDRSTLRSATEVADRWMAGQGPQAEVVVRRIILRLVRLSADGQRFEPVPASRASLYDAYHSAELVDRALAALASAGVIRITAGATPEADQVQLRSRELLTEWGALADWLDQRLRFRHGAESWVREKSPKSDLLKGEALEEARAYQDRNAAERKLVDDSRYAERLAVERNRRLVWVFGLLAVVALSGWAASIILYKAERKSAEKANALAIQEKSARSKAETATKQANADRAAAEQARAELAEKNEQIERKRLELAKNNEQLDRKRVELAEKNEQLEHKIEELRNINLRITAHEEQNLIQQSQQKVKESRAGDRPVVSAALARDPELKGQWRLWKNGSTLHVSFLDGDDRTKNLVMKYATEWSQHANLKFDFDPGPGLAPIRITFSKPGSWSALGTDALTVASEQPTMNLGQIISSPSEADAARVIRHEFGHVLGLIHEHQSPNARIDWNKEAVFQYYSGPPNLWPRNLVEQTILRKSPAFNDPNYRPFDPSSIMMFPIDPGLANISVGWNFTLSASDKKFAGELYPRPANQPMKPR